MCNWGHRATRDIRVIIHNFLQPLCAVPLDLDPSHYQDLDLLHFIVMRMIRHYAEIWLVVIISLMWVQIFPFFIRGGGSLFFLFGHVSVCCRGVDRWRRVIPWWCSQYPHRYGGPRTCSQRGSKTVYEVASMPFSILLFFHLSFILFQLHKSTQKYACHVALQELDHSSSYSSSY